MEKYIKLIAKEIGFKTIVCSSKRGADTNDLEFMTNEPNGPHLSLYLASFVWVKGFTKHILLVCSDIVIQ